MFTVPRQLMIEEEYDNLEYFIDHSYRSRLYMSHKGVSYKVVSVSGEIVITTAYDHTGSELLITEEMYRDFLDNFNAIISLMDVSIRNILAIDEEG